MSYTVERTREMVVHIPNTPGTLGKLAQLLGSEDINILGYAAVGWNDQGTVHLITDDAAEAETVLEASGYQVDTRGALVVHVPNKPGQLGRLAAKLGQSGVNIEASFVASADGGGGLRCVFSVDDADAGEKVLEES